MPDDAINMEVQSLVFDKSFFDQQQAIKWCRDNGFLTTQMREDGNSIIFDQKHVDDFEDVRKLSIIAGVDQMVGKVRENAPQQRPQTRIIKDVEIFSEGVWNGIEITENDLDILVRSFDITKDHVRPYLKLGHDDSQKLVQNDGLPAAGFIDNLRKVGTKLVCDFVDVPRKIADLIDLKAYRKVSSEIFHNIEISGEVFTKMLGAVALLGADTPGVMNLNDILSMYGLKADRVKFDNDKQVIEYSREDNMPTEKEIVLQKDLEVAQKELDALKAEKSEFSKKDDELKAAQDKLKEQANAIEKFKKSEADAVAKAEAARIDAFCTELEKEKLAVPSMKDHVKALIGPHKDEYSVGDKKKSKEEVLKEVLQLFKASLDVNEEENTDGGKSVDDSVEAKIGKYMKDNPDVSYKQAFTACAGRKLEE